MLWTNWYAEETPYVLENEEEEEVFEPNWWEVARASSKRKITPPFLIWRNG